MQYIFFEIQECLIQLDNQHLINLREINWHKKLKIALIKIIKSIFAINAMALELQEEKQAQAQVSHLINSCNCNHCLGIRRQQKESELRWVKLHQLFDR